MNLLLPFKFIYLLLFIQIIINAVEPLKVAIISEGSPNDLGFNYQINQGIRDIERELNSTTMDFYPNISQDCTDFVKDLIENKGYKVIIGPATVHSTKLKELSHLYLDTYFMYSSLIFDTFNVSKVMILDYNYETINYICGFYAALITKTNKLGYVASGPPLFNNYPVNSFYIGAYSANSNVTLEYYTIGSWVNPKLSIGASKDLISKKIDIIGQNLQDMSVSLTSVENGGNGIGTNGFNQSIVFGKKIPFSYIVNWKDCFSKLINYALNNATIPRLKSSYRGDVGNGFIRVAMSDNIDPEIKTKINNELLIISAQPKFKTKVFCNPFNPYLFSNVPLTTYCISQYKLYNNSDPFPNMTYYGNYTTPIELVPIAESITRVFSTISGVLLGCSLLLIALVSIFGDRATFRFASPIFCILIILGGMIVYGGIIVWVVPLTKVTCTLRLWLVSEGFTILIGSIVVKNLRIWLIFDNPELRTIRITNFQLFPWIFFLIVMNSFLMVIISYRGGMEVVDIYGVDGLNSNEYLQTCDMNQIGWSAFYSLLGYFCALISVGLFASWKIRIFDIAKFNESKPIAHSLYTMAFGLTIIISLIVSPQTYQNQTIILSIAGLFITTTTLLILFVPKFLYLNSNYFIENRQSIITTLRYGEQSDDSTCMP